MISNLPAEVIIEIIASQNGTYVASCLNMELTVEANTLIQLYKDVESALVRIFPRHLLPAAHQIHFLLYK